MTAEILDGLLWAVMLGTAVAASSWLRGVLGVLLASQGLIATISGLVFVRALAAQGGPVLAAGTTVMLGVFLGLGHLFLLRATNREIFLVATVLLSFFLADLWLSAPGLTGGSGGILVERRAIVAVSAIFLALLLCRFGLMRLIPDGGGFAASTTRELGMAAGVLGVPVGRAFYGGFGIFGVIMSLLGIAGVSVAGVSSPSLFGVAWSLSVLLIVVSAGFSPVVRVCVLPVLFVGSRWLLRALLPPSVGFSQLAELAFPMMLVVWSRLSTEGVDG